MDLVALETQHYTATGVLMSRLLSLISLLAISIFVSKKKISCKRKNNATTKEESLIVEVMNA